MGRLLRLLVCLPGKAEASQVAAGCMREKREREREREREKQRLVACVGTVAARAASAVRNRWHLIAGQTSDPIWSVQSTSET